MKWFSHPSDVCMTYIEHLKLSITFSYLMQKGAIKSLIHAFLPDFCVTSTSDINEKLTTLLKNNGCHNSTSKSTNKDHIVNDKQD